METSVKTEKISDLTNKSECSKKCQIKPICAFLNITFYNKTYVLL